MTDGEMQKLTITSDTYIFMMVYARNKEFIDDDVGYKFKKNLTLVQHALTKM